MLFIKIFAKKKDHDWPLFMRNNLLNIRCQVFNTLVELIQLRFLMDSSAIVCGNIVWVKQYVTRVTESQIPLSFYWDLEKKN